MRGEGIQVPLYAGHHRPASETPFKWRFAGVPMMDQHPSFARKPYMFVIFRGGGPDPLPPSGSTHVHCHCVWMFCVWSGLCYSYLGPFYLTVIEFFLFDSHPAEKERARCSLFVYLL